MDDFVSVYSKTTGIKQRVPKSWLEHPALGRDFQREPLEEVEAAEVVEDQPVEPTESWKREDLDQHALTLNGLDTSEMRNKADVLAAIAAAAAEQANQDPGGTPPSDETPATGDTEEE